MLASVVTGVLALLACTLGFLVVFMSSQAHLLQRPVTWIVGYVESVIKDTAGGLSALQEAARLQPIILPGMVFPSFGIWLYAPCFPFVWVWLYLLSGGLHSRRHSSGVQACARRHPRPAGSRHPTVTYPRRSGGGRGQCAVLDRPALAPLVLRTGAAHGYCSIPAYWRTAYVIIARSMAGTVSSAQHRAQHLRDAVPSVARGTWLL